MERRKPPDEKRRAIENLLSRDGGDATMIRRPGDPGHPVDDETKVRKVRQRSFELGEENPFELKKPDDAIKHANINLDDDTESDSAPDGYAPTGLGATGADDDEAPPLPSYIQRSGGHGARNAIIIAAVILFIGAAASALILAREQIMSLFTGTTTPVSDEAAAARIAQLEKENADLRASLEAGGGETSVELGNLRSANASLQQSLNDERDRADNLQKQLDTFKNADASDDPALKNAKDQVDKLTADLAKARTTISELQQEVDNANERMVNYTRENSRLNQELEAAKRDTRDVSSLRRENEHLTSRVESLNRDLDSANSQINVLRSRISEGQGSNDELESVNKEYRRVLNLLTESREANNHKQDRIDELLAENSKLREQVDTMQRQTSSSNTRQVSTNTAGSSTSSGITRDPTPTNIVRPEYPPSALRRKVSGTVELNVLVSETGQVLDAKVIRSPDPLRSLDKAALAAVRQWRFSPAMRNGRAVQVWHRVPMEFTLNRDDED